jgi:hypothetical protein
LTFTGSLQHALDNTLFTFTTTDNVLLMLCFFLSQATCNMLHALNATLLTFTNIWQHALDATLFSFTSNLQQALDATSFPFASNLQHALDEVKQKSALTEVSRFFHQNHIFSNFAKEKKGMSNWPPKNA